MSYFDINLRRFVGIDLQKPESRRKHAIFRDAVDGFAVRTGEFAHGNYPLSFFAPMRLSANFS